MTIFEIILLIILIIAAVVNIWFVYLPMQKRIDEYKAKLNKWFMIGGHICLKDMPKYCEELFNTKKEYNEIINKLRCDARGYKEYEKKYKDIVAEFESVINKDMKATEKWALKFKLRREAFDKKRSEKEITELNELDIINF